MAQFSTVTNVVVVYERTFKIINTTTKTKEKNQFGFKKKCQLFFENDAKCMASK